MYFIIHIKKDIFNFAVQPDEIPLEDDFDI